MKITAVIMAGGCGERFWPRSRKHLPKQFLSLTADGETMIQKTVKRLLPLVQPEDVFIVTNKQYLPLVREQLSNIPEQNLLAEPEAKNTAPCVALAAAVVRARYEDAVMLVLPSDHLIRYEDMYLDTLNQAIRVAEQSDCLVTVGITPTYPETGYGYIKFMRSQPGEAPGVYRVECFKEKPDLDTAKQYLASRRYLWNSGMFVWRSSVILEQFRLYMPAIFDGAERLTAAADTPAFSETLEACFHAFPSESIDFGILEKASNIYTIPGSFGWDDVGSWLALERINPTDANGNVLSGDVVTVDTASTTICGGKRLIAAIGLENLIVVDADDALLICAKDSAQHVKQVLVQLRKQHREDVI